MLVYEVDATTRQSRTPAKKPVSVHRLVGRLLGPGRTDPRQRRLVGAAVERRELHLVL
jgi:hypothetical protein